MLFALGCSVAILLACALVFVPLMVADVTGNLKVWFPIQIVCWMVVIFVIVYECNKPTPKFSGYVAQKAHYPAYTSYVMSGNIMVPIFHPERWNVVLHSEGKGRSCDVSQDTYSQIDLGNAYTCPGDNNGDNSGDSNGDDN